MAAIASVIKIVMTLDEYSSWLTANMLIDVTAIIIAANFGADLTCACPESINVLNDSLKKSSDPNLILIEEIFRSELQAGSLRNQ